MNKWLWGLVVLLFFIIFRPSGVNAASLSVKKIIPIRTPGFMIGAFYMPMAKGRVHQWLPMYKYNKENVRRWPLLDLYDGTSSQVLSWQIKWARENGISFFAFDWFWDGNKKPNFNTSLPAFLNSPYSSKMKFTIAVFGLKLNESFNYMVQGVDISQSQDKKINLSPNRRLEFEKTLNQAKIRLQTVANYWVDNYFKRDNYLKDASGRPIVIVPLWDEIGQFNRLSWACSNINNPPADCSFLFNPNLFFANIIQQRMGVKPIWIALRLWDAGRDNNFYLNEILRAKTEGYTAITAYGFGDKSADPTIDPDYRNYSLDFKNLMSDLSCRIEKKIGDNFYLIPAPLAGLDNSPFKSNPSKFTNINSQSWLKALQTTKDILTSGSCRQNFWTLNNQKVILLASWNEWAEDTFIEPGRKEGGNYNFDYLDKVKAVFAEPGHRYSVNTLPAIVSHGPYQATPWSAKTDEKISNWHTVHGEYLGNHKFYFSQMWIPAKKRTAGFLINLIPVYKLADQARFFYLKFKAGCGPSFNQDCHWHNGFISWSSSDDSRPTLFNNGDNRKWFYGRGGTDDIITTKAGQVQEVIVDLKDQPHYHGLIEQAALRLSTFGQSGQVEILQAGFYPRPPIQKKYDVNGNNKSGDRGDVICFISQYLAHQGRSVRLIGNNPYDLNGDGLFNRQDVIKAIVNYLKNPLISQVSKSCLRLEN